MNYFSSLTVCTHICMPMFLFVNLFLTHVCFSVGFRTTPMDSTGVSHILEHTVLCGSQRFPVRDPFFKMLNRSLSTFMNAFTGTSFTAVTNNTRPIALKILRYSCLLVDVNERKAVEIVLNSENISRQQNKEIDSFIC